MITVLDVETTKTELANGKETPSPYQPANSLVSVGWRTKSVRKYCFFNHPDNTQDVVANRAALQKQLDNTTLLVGQSIKFDLQWLKEAGFNYTGRVYDTMTFEYLKQKGIKVGLGLAEIAERRNLQAKGDILKQYFKEGKNTTDVPLELLEEYGLGDVDITWDVFWQQVEEAKTNPELIQMCNMVRLTNDVTYVLAELERNGCKIDEQRLLEIEQEYRDELQRLENVLTDIVCEVMGHTKINLASPEHLSWVIYGRKVKDKKVWAEVFNIGSEERGSVVKKKRATFMSDSKFKATYTLLTERMVKTTAEQCPECSGSGYVQLYKKDGNPCKRLNVCKTCEKKGYVFIDRTEYAGLKLKPKSSSWCAAGGFKADGGTIEELLQDDISDTARMFLEALSRYNSISSYLSSFVDGIKYTMVNGILHTNFNQTIVTTGRLSSSNPNLQNMPRDKTFPIRTVFCSRWADGTVVDCDWSQLEFRVAGLLSGCPQVRAFVDAKKDIHSVSMTFFGWEGKEGRQRAKAETFGPLYGKITKYTEYFYQQFPGIQAWHTRLMDEAVTNKQTVSPLGRIYAFPGAKRLANGLVAGHTQIKNYSVQGMGWDIMAMVLVDIYWRMQERKLKSLLILTVHDSLLADCYPGEEEAVRQCFQEGFGNINNLLKQRFNVISDMPFDYEIGSGRSWGTTEK